MKECENINSRNKCQAMADGQTTSDSSTGKLAGFLDVVLLLSATFYLKIILRRQKISNFITKDNESTAAILWSSRIPICYWRYNMISDTTTHTRKSLFHEKRRIEEQASWRVSWSDSTAASHYPSQNHFKMEKISTSRKFSRILLPKAIARLRGPCGLANFYMLLAIQRDFRCTPLPTRGKIVFTPPRNI